ncbi:hypothetical protein NUBL21993_46140 [Klebsiella pneumoniae]|nr:hypothetical protein NUBL21976_44800 [Klebsiella pneumoniae]GKL71922.1 hypothetical protein NUBL21993_46140 [Klebsiella pneumoniae]GKO22467.1 hypothetical protein MS5935_39000 [Klebsiella pneumoniae]
MCITANKIEKVNPPIIYPAFSPKAFKKELRIIPLKTSSSRSGKIIIVADIFTAAISCDKPLVKSVTKGSFGVR